jgi:hypothetical protein
VIPPPKQVCPLCGDDEGVSVLPDPESGGWRFTCAPAQHHADPYAWTVDIPSPFEGRDGVTAELGLYDHLPDLVAAQDPWLEYGVVEHRYKEAHPDVYAELLRLYGHRAREPKPFTLSVVVAKALGQLAREGGISFRWGRATGYWSYNGTISYWAPAPPPAPSSELTWTTFAKHSGIASDAWALPESPKER